MNNINQININRNNYDIVENLFTALAVPVSSPTSQVSGSAQVISSNPATVSAAMPTQRTSQAAVPSRNQTTSSSSATGSAPARMELDEADPSSTSQVSVSANAGSASQVTSSNSAAIANGDLFILRQPIELATATISSVLEPVRVNATMPQNSIASPATAPTQLVPTAPTSSHKRPRTIVTWTSLPFSKRCRVEQEGPSLT